MIFKIILIITTIPVSYFYYIFRRISRKTRYPRVLPRATLSLLAGKALAGRLDSPLSLEVQISRQLQDKSESSQPRQAQLQLNPGGRNTFPFGFWRVFRITSQTRSGPRDSQKLDAVPDQLVSSIRRVNRSYNRRAPHSLYKFSTGQFQSRIGSDRLGSDHDR